MSTAPASVMRSLARASPPGLGSEMVGDHHAYQIASFELRYWLQER